MTAIAWLLLRILPRAAHPGARVLSYQYTMFNRAPRAAVHRTVVILDVPSTPVITPSGRLRAGAHQIPFEET